MPVEVATKGGLGYHCKISLQLHLWLVILSHCGATAGCRNVTHAPCIFLLTFNSILIVALQLNEYKTYLTSSAERRSTLIKCTVGNTERREGGRKGPKGACTYDVCKWRGEAGVQSLSDIVTTTLWHLLLFLLDIATIFPIPKSQFQYCSLIAL